MYLVLASGYACCTQFLLLLVTWLFEGSTTTAMRLQEPLYHHMAADVGG